MRGISKERQRRRDISYEMWERVKETRFGQNLTDFAKREGILSFEASIQARLAYVQWTVSTALRGPGLETEIVLHRLGLHPKGDGRKLDEEEISKKTGIHLAIVRVVGRYGLMKLDKAFPFPQPSLATA